jgi:hypothetical protein
MPVVFIGNDTEHFAQTTTMSLPTRRKARLDPVRSREFARHYTCAVAAAKTTGREITGERGVLVSPHECP